MYSHSLKLLARHVNFLRSVWRQQGRNSADAQNICGEVSWESASIFSGCQGLSFTSLIFMCFVFASDSTFFGLLAGHLCTASHPGSQGPGEKSFSSSAHWGMILRLLCAINLSSFKCTWVPIQVLTQSAGSTMVEDFHVANLAEKCFMEMIKTPKPPTTGITTLIRFSHAVI